MNSTSLVVASVAGYPAEIGTNALMKVCDLECLNADQWSTADTLPGLSTLDANKRCINDSEEEFSAFEKEVCNFDDDDDLGSLAGDSPDTMHSDEYKHRAVRPVGQPGFQCPRRMRCKAVEQIGVSTAPMEPRPQSATAKFHRHKFSLARTPKATDREIGDISPPPPCLEELTLAGSVGSALRKLARSEN